MKDQEELIYIHYLIQSRDYDFPGFIREYDGQIDDHVLICEACHERMIGFTSSLPKLRARMSVQLAEPYNYMKELGQLKRGQCLPCGCEVTDSQWTREQAKSNFCKALVEVLKITEEEARRIPDQFKLCDLPLSTQSLRQLRDKFWIPDGSSGSEEVRDKEEGGEVLQLPETVGQFINQILNPHSGFSFVQCHTHWDPC